MIKWAEEMYFDQYVKKRKRRIMWAIQTGRVKLGIYCITLAGNPENLLEIMDVNELKFPYYKRQDIYILGLALGRERAMKLVAHIIDEVYQETGDVKVREYFQDRWKAC